METRCEVRTVTGVTSDGQGGDRVTYSPVIYDGKCRIRNRGAAFVDVESGSQTVGAEHVEWHVPVGAADEIPKGAVVFIGAVASWRVIDGSAGDDMSARRYPVERVS